VARKKSQENIRDRILLDAFWMPSIQTMVSRKSSITNAFVNALLPNTPPTAEEIELALQILKMEPTNLRCSYCGDKASEWDHLRPIVVNLRPTGYISEIANLVPACGKCNQSKRNATWRDWMLSSASLSPTGRGLKNVLELMARLEENERWKSPTKLDFEQILGKETWQKYWAMWDAINIELRTCQEFADDLRDKISKAIKTI
jgi:5-methylcytosine-specific restriction endonuclease McrA